MGHQHCSLRVSQRKVLDGPKNRHPGRAAVARSEATVGIVPERRLLGRSTAGDGDRWHGSEDTENKAARREALKLERNLPRLLQPVLCWLHRVPRAVVSGETRPDDHAGRIRPRPNSSWKAGARQIQAP